VNHRNHLIPCVLAVIVAVALFSAAGANPLAAGVGLAFLVCPIVMGVVMWLLMRQPSSSTAPREHDGERPPMTSDPLATSATTPSPPRTNEAVVAHHDERP
jgi:hypothetical protein